MLVVLLTLVIGLFILLEVYAGQLTGNLDATLEQQVADRASLIDNGGAKDLLTVVLQEEAFVWIGSADGAVSAQGGAIVVLENPVPDRIGQTTTVSLLVEERKPNEIEQERMELRVASTQAETGQVVLAGAELEVVDRAVADLAVLFASSIPILVAIVGALAWLIAGRALAPVDAIRSRADAITGATLTERVPVPETADEIHDLALTVNEMLDRIERHDASLRQFSSDASHELKSPVANIKALVETRTSTDPGWSSIQTQLTDETARLSALVDNLLFLATHEDASRSVDGHPVSLDELLFAEAELLSVTTALRIDMSNVEPTSVVGSISDLSRLVRNLVDNAARHAEGRVALSVRTNAGVVELCVEDDGSGIAEDDHDRIFERFTRLDEARARDDGGTGLGLSIVKRIATEHGATISVANSTLGGASFTVTWLPTSESVLRLD